MPLALKGPAPVTNWSPPIFSASSDDVLARLTDLYRNDPLLAESLAMAKENRALDVDINRRESRRFTRDAMIVLSSIGRLMGVAGGPNIGMVALDGWDTHNKQQGVLNNKFADLDMGLSELKTSLGSSWDKTCIVICSEFGRTAALLKAVRFTAIGRGLDPQTYMRGVIYTPLMMWPLCLRA